MEKNSLNVAIIDMYDGIANQGMRGIKEILRRFEVENNIPVNFEIFDLRGKGEIPNLDFNVYISTGGPGDPSEGLGAQWENDFFDLLDSIDLYNKSQPEQKKYAFLICHSFQLACRKYGLGTVTRRKSNAFGIFPITLTPEGEQDEVFAGITNPFYSVDSRDWQVIEPDLEDFERKGATILAIEKERKHVDLERCIMSIRYTNEIIGTQFHPEADPAGMKIHLLTDEKKTSIIETHGEAKYLDMLNSLDNPDRIRLTQSVILPNFLHNAIGKLQEA